MSDTETRKETKEERKERKRLKKLKKEAKKAKKRKLEELQNGTTEEVETPAAKKMKLSDDEKEPTATEEVNFDGINKAIVTAAKEHLQNAVLHVAKLSPSNIPEMEANLYATEIDPSVKAILYTPSPGKIAGVVRSWVHEKGFGFIKRDDGKDDVFVHYRACWIDPKTGHRNLKKGSHVEFDEVPGRSDPTKTQADEVAGLGGGYAEGGMQMEGTVSSWKGERSFGFITGDDGNEYLAMDRDIWIPSATLTPGGRVQFDIKVKQDGRSIAVYVNELGAEYREDAWDNYNAEQEQAAVETGGDDQTAEQNGAEGQEAQPGTATGADQATAGGDTAGGDAAGGDAADATPATPTPGKTTGVVLRWKHEKGFGFIKPDDGTEDLFVHIKEVWYDQASGLRSLKNNSKVEFEAKDGEKGKFASNVTAIGGGNAASGMEMEGTVAKWLADKGFGFITGDDGNDYFAPDRDIWITSGVLTPGERVQFDIKRKDDGRCQAVYINTVGAEYKEDAWDNTQQWDEAAAEGGGDDQNAEQNGAEQY